MCAVQINNQKLTVEALHKTRKEAEQESAVQMLSLIEKHYSIL
jgi:dsRNA-specific ribonuclease